MKKFTFKGVLDGFRSTVQPPVRGADQEIQETLRPEHFQLKKTFRHGFPFSPTAIAWDPIQKLLAIGDKSGSLRLLGRPGVDAHVRHDGEAAGVTHVQFLVNEGALVTATADDSLHLWNFRQKSPQVVHTLKFQREKITCLHLPLQSKWLHVGTERGNVHVVHIETFVLSGYIINWNKAIEPVRSTHPGSVVQIVDNPLDASKLLIAFESGQMAIWDLRTRVAEFRCISSEPLRWVTWHNEGKQFMSCHTDGSLCTWTVRQPPKPLTVSYPHAKTNKDGKLESCKPIQKVEWKTSKAGESYVIFSGGLPFDKAGRTPSITVINGKAITVLEMEHNVIDFITLCDSPWSGDLTDPYAIVVLLQNDLVVIDLQTPGYPCFENPYPMDLHESPVTCCSYFADCPSDLIPAFYSVGRQCSQKRVGFSEREWPVNGGEWSPASCSYNEIILTGHADGSIKFWDASAGTLQILYKLKTAKVFEKPRARSVDGTEEDPLSIQLISLCPESRKMAVAGAGGHVIFFKFRKTESSSETHVLEIPLNCDVSEDAETSPDCEFIPSHRHSVSQDLEKKVWSSPQLRVRGGAAVRKAAGFQAALVCLPPTPPRPPDPAQPSQFNITALTINSSYGLMAFGNDHGLVIVDVVRRVIVWSASSAELYGSQDPYCRSPRRTCPEPPLSSHAEAPTSPSIDQAQQEDKIIEYTESNQPSNIAQSSGLSHGSMHNLESSVEVADEAYIELSPNSKREMSASIAIQNNPSQHSSCHAGSLPITEMTETNDCLNLTAEEKSKIEAAQNRRKSTTWKTFNLKRQLSKVDIKFKNTFSVAQEKKESDFKDANPKKNSVFYFPNSEGSSLSPVETDGESPINPVAQRIEESCESSKATADPADSENDQNQNVETVPSEGIDQSINVEKKSINMYDRMHQELRESYGWKSEVPVDEGSTKSPIDEKEDGNKSSRPDNLPLFDEDGKPVRPPRQYKKSKSIIAGDKRDQRLLSVPNIKYARPENVLKDLRKKDATSQSQPTFAGNIMRRFRKCLHRLCRSRRCHKKSSRKKSKQIINSKHIDKLDSSFSRSRSSSMSSLENISTEAVQCLAFADSYTKKSDPSALLPTLWVGTSLGSVLTVMINLPEPDVRHTQPVVVSILGGPIFRLKGSILTMSFLDCNGALIPYAYEPWRDENKEGREKRDRTPTKQQSSGSGSSSRMSPTPGASGSACDAGLCSDRQFVVIASEKQARVVALPSQNCVYRQQLVDTDFVVKAEIVSMKDSVCLVCYFSSGHLFAYSLPSLRPLIDINFLPLSELSFQTQCKQGGIVDPMLSIWGQQLIVNEDTDQIARTFCFSNRGHGLYLSSPSEVQKFTIDIEFCQAVNEMMGELFLARDMPEPPKESFFRGLFGGGARPLDREELFGEGSGKPSRTVAKHIPGPTGNVEAIGTRASTATSEIARAHMMVVERGEKLGQLEDRAERMASNAQEFGSTAHQLMLKYKDKKWYQL